jgi:membrane protein DedA with SNARE-associated domain
MISNIEILLTSLITTLPLELFAFVASFIEEIIAPIPSPTVMILTGAAALVQGYTIPSLILLIFIAACGKTIGALIVYIIADKSEDYILGMFKKFFVVSRDEIAQFGNKLTGGSRDYMVLILIRAFPFVPSVVVSVGSGILKIQKKLYIITTFIGTVIRDSIYLTFGYIGSNALGVFIEHSQVIEHYIEYIVSILIACVLIFLSIRLYITHSKQ